MRYELWDGETANCVGAYDSESEALTDVLKTANEYGAYSAEAQQLGLIEHSDDVPSRLVAEGQALVQIARTSRVILTENTSTVGPPIGQEGVLIEA